MSYSPEVKQEALELHAIGATQLQIAERLGVGKSTIARWVNPEHNQRSLEYSRQRYQEDPEYRAKRQAATKQWKIDNRERHLQQKREYRQRVRNAQQGA